MLINMSHTHLDTDTFLWKYLNNIDMHIGFLCLYISHLLGPVCGSRHCTSVSAGNH